MTVWKLCAIRLCASTCWLTTAILKMGQLREPGRGRGQILASLVPGAWRIAWVRDMAYAILGLVRAGHLAEAKLALEFMLNAEMRRDGDRNFYDVNFIERDLGVTLSADYAISVTRYFGDGTEESDSNAAGPNIEFDNWGLFLWALGAYVEYRDNRVAMFVRQLPRGRHSLTYRLRAEIPGSFSALPAQASGMYAPELAGNSDEMKLGIGD